VGNGGADLFYRITSNWVSSTTFNTDFAETEVDTRQPISPLPLFFPEKRGFFLEDAASSSLSRRGRRRPPGQQGGGDLIPFFPPHWAGGGRGSALRAGTS